MDVATDFDSGAMLGIGCNAAGPLETRISIRIETAEPEEAVEALVQGALSMDPWFLALKDAQSVKTLIDVEPGGAAS